MILGIGTDLCDSRRIGRVLARFGTRFEARILTPTEQRLGTDQTAEQRILYCAKRFAAKEAVLKALGTGLAQGASWQDITITRMPGGQPGVLAPRLLAERSWSDARIHLSLSDEPPYALAFVVISR